MDITALRPVIQHLCCLCASPGKASHWWKVAALMAKAGASDMPEDDKDNVLESFESTFQVCAKLYLLLYRPCL